MEHSIEQCRHWHIPQARLADKGVVDVERLSAGRALTGEVRIPASGGGELAVPAAGIDNVRLAVEGRHETRHEESGGLVTNVPCPRGSTCLCT